MMNNKISVRQVRFAEAQPNIEQIRRTVFIEEQLVPEELEWDGLDNEAIQILVTSADATPVATARMLHNGHIGRMAVLPAWRNQGLGRSMLDRLLKIARNKGLPRVYLNAQVSAIDFYLKAGFHVEGETFMDAGIPHQRMVLELERND